MSVFLSLVLFCTTCPARKNLQRRRWRGEAPGLLLEPGPWQGGVGQDVVVGDEDSEEGEEEEDEVVAEGNRPPEIVKRARCNVLFQLPPRPRRATMFLGSVAALVPPQGET